MLPITTIQIIAAGLIGVTVIGGGTLLTIKIAGPGPQSSIYGFQLDLSAETGTTTPVFDGKGYKCQYKNKVFPCKITEPDLEISKKITLKQQFSKSKEVSSITPLIDKKLYKITASTHNLAELHELLASSKFQDETIKIVKASDHKQKYYEIIPQFSLQGDIAAGAPSYYIGKSGKEVTATSSEFSCKINTAEAKKCFLFELDSTNPSAEQGDLSKLTFDDKIQDSLTEIKKGRYYLISMGLNNMKVALESITVEKKDTPATSSIFSSISPVVYDRALKNLLVF